MAGKTHKSMPRWVTCPNIRIWGVPPQIKAYFYVSYPPRVNMSDYVMTSFKACMPHAGMIRRRHHSNPTCPRKKELIGVHASFG